MENNFIEIRDVITIISTTSIPVAALVDITPQVFPSSQMPVLKTLFTCKTYRNSKHYTAILVWQKTESVNYILVLALCSNISYQAMRPPFLIQTPFSNASIYSSIVLYFCNVLSRGLNTSNTRCLRPHSQLQCCLTFWGLSTLFTVFLN